MKWLLPLEETKEKYVGYYRKKKCFYFLHVRRKTFLHSSEYLKLLQLFWSVVSITKN